MTKRKGRRKPGLSAYQRKQPVRKTYPSKRQPSSRLQSSTVASRMGEALMYWNWGWRPEALEIAFVEMEALLAEQS